VTPRTAGVVALLALAGGCKRPAPTGDPQEPSDTASAPSESQANTTPVDHLAPGELLEGPVRVFGLPLPRAATVKGTFVDVAYASAPVSVDALARYFRPRLQGGRLREGPEAATFEHVKVPGKPGVELLVRVAAAADGSSIEVRDSTPPPAPALPDEASRWKAVGMTPEGRLADPRHLD
jgi:hypothetical protein